MLRERIISIDDGDIGKLTTDESLCKTVVKGRRKNLNGSFQQLNLIPTFKNPCLLTFIITVALLLQSGVERRFFCKYSTGNICLRSGFGLA